MHNKCTTSDSHAPNGTFKHPGINAESMSYVLRYNLGLDISRPEPESFDTDRK